MNGTSCCEPCRESIKSVKERIKKAKTDLKQMAEMLERVDIGYESRLQVIGGMYMNLHRAKRELEYRKKEK